MTRDNAPDILKRLRVPLASRGVAHAALFGSMARGENTSHSDVDIIVTPAPGRRLDLFTLGAVQSLLDDSFGCAVDLIVEPVQKASLRQAIARDRMNAF
jgi:predicted nucleotidyltransferase